MTKLLILDDERFILELLKDTFETEGVELFLESDSNAALERIRTERPHVALIDINLPGKSGMDILREAKKIDPGLSVIMMTGYSTTMHAIEAMKEGAYDYITKPFDIDKLQMTVQKAMECNLLNRKVRFATDSSRIADKRTDEDVMVGSSAEMLEIWKMVGRIANSDATVLIQGESGTGKELLARAIYNTSRRRNRPFLAVNCAALPEALLESELFGHEKGAFTDAHARRIGKFEQCNGGTIFLDEIGEMSPANQSKLLRVLENQEFERVGGNETIKVDVRIIAATNRSLLQAVHNKAFRIDLFYRLRVVSFYLPPLRERVEDIPLLTHLFMERFSSQYGKRVKGISPDALNMLVRHHWDGNVRELKNAINSAVVLGKADLLGAEDFESLLQTGSGQHSIDLDHPDGDFSALFRKLLASFFDNLCRANKGAVYDHVTTELESALFQLAMEKNNNNQVLAAKCLGVSRNTLRSRIGKSKP